MNLIIWIIFGALAGWIASIIMNTNRDQGALLNILIGIAGAIIGGFIVQMFGGSGVTGFNLGSLVVAVFGAVGLLAVVRAFAHR